VRIYQVQLPLTRYLTNLVSDVSDLATRIDHVFAAYTSQRYSVQRTMRSRRYAARYYGFKRLAEEFWEVPAGSYRQYHETDPAGWSTNSFWSLRYYPFVDPLAYKLGTAERRRLARLAHELSVVKSNRENK
jgi:hypothetical protein